MVFHQYLDIKCYSCIHIDPPHSNMSSPGCDKSPIPPSYLRTDCFGFGDINVAGNYAWFWTRFEIIIRDFTIILWINAIMRYVIMNEKVHVDICNSQTRMYYLLVCFQMLERLRTNIRLLKFFFYTSSNQERLRMYKFETWWSKIDFQNFEKLQKLT